MKSINVNNRELYYFNTIAEELAVDDKALHVLEHLGSLCISGPEAESFLQGQISIDVTQCDTAQYGCYSNKEGRLVSIFYCLKQDADFHLMMPKDMIPFCEKKLKHYGMFSKISFTTPEVTVFCSGDALNDLKITDNDDAFKAIKEKYQTIKAGLGWHYQQLQQHRPSLYPETVETFLPHRIGLHKQQALDFDKGCYLGQEIIARMHYKAKLKHEMQLLQHEANISPGEKITKDGKDIGEAIDSCPQADGSHLILAAIKQ